MKKTIRIQGSLLGSDLSTVDIYQKSGSIETLVTGSLPLSTLNAGIDLVLPVSASSLVFKSTGSLICSGAYKEESIDSYVDGIRHIKAYVDSDIANKGEITDENNNKSVSYYTPIERELSTAPGNSVILTASPKTGYMFKGWYTKKNASGSLMSINNTLTISENNYNVNAEGDIYFASFEEK